MIFRMTVLLLFVGQGLRANVRSHSSLASSSARAAGISPLPSRNTLPRLPRKNFSNLAHAREARVRNVYKPSARRRCGSSTACHFFLAMNPYHMGYPSDESMSTVTIPFCHLSSRNDRHFLRRADPACLAAVPRGPSVRYRLIV